MLPTRLLPAASWPLGVVLSLLLIAGSIGCYDLRLGVDNDDDDDDSASDDDDDSAAGDDDTADDDDDTSDDDDDTADDDDDDTGDDDDTSDDCSPDGATTCFGNDWMACASTEWTLTETCVEPTPICHNDLGCLACSPGLQFCDGNTVVECNGDGSGSTVIEECASGAICAGGECLDACDLAEQQLSYLGCEFLAVSTANIVGAEFDGDFAVVIGNPAGNADANVAVSRGGNVIASQVVPSGQTAAIQLPMVSDLKNASQSVVVTDGAYEVISDVPVAAYQYNPLHFDIGGTPSYTNDASLLLPEHVLTGSYRAITWPTWGYGSWTDFLGTPLGDWSAWYPGFVAVVATEDNTQVTFTSSTLTEGGNPAALSPGQDAVVTLNRGDVMQVFSRRYNEDEAYTYCSGNGWDSTEISCPPAFGFPPADCEAYCSVNDADLTGSAVTSSAPVAVFAGHMCTFMPYDEWACDHLEEMMFPTETWGSLSVMSAPVHPGTSGVAPTLYRVMALNNATGVTFSPAVNGPVTLDAGEFVQFETDQDFVVEGTGQIFVTQTMLGETALGDQGGDPAMGSGIPWVQVRASYDFLTPDTYTNNYVNVVAPTGSTVELDGSPVAGWQNIGSTGYAVARVSLSAGSHHIESAGGTGFGITTYGYASFTSYLYPGGLNFTR